MKMSVVKVPFGPEYVLYEGEFFAVTRHRIMLFFYFGIACMILVATMGRNSTVRQPELALAIAAIEVFVGVIIVVLCKLLAVWRARRNGTIPRVRMAWVLVATVTGAVASAEVFEPFFFGAALSTPLHFVMKLVFYIVVVELLTSIMMQYTLGYILKDLRKDKRFDENGGLLGPALDRVA